MTKPKPEDYCKGIYAGCCVTGCQSPCQPCERIKKIRHKSNCAARSRYRWSCDCGAIQKAIAKEMVRKERLEKSIKMNYKLQRTLEFIETELKSYKNSSNREVLEFWDGIMIEADRRIAALRETIQRTDI